MREEIKVIDGKKIMVKVFDSGERSDVFLNEPLGRPFGFNRGKQGKKKKDE